MTGQLVTAAPDWAIIDAAALMVKHGVRHVLVFEASELVGILFDARRRPGRRLRPPRGDPRGGVGLSARGAQEAVRGPRMNRPVSLPGPQAAPPANDAAGRVPEDLAPLIREAAQRRLALKPTL